MGEEKQKDQDTSPRPSKRGTLLQEGGELRRVSQSQVGSPEMTHTKIEKAPETKAPKKDPCVRIKENNGMFVTQKGGERSKLSDISRECQASLNDGLKCLSLTVLWFGQKEKEHVLLLYQ